jgi:hypothetical protein
VLICNENGGDLNLKNCLVFGVNLQNGTEFHRDHKKNPQSFPSLQQKNPKN